MMKYAQDPQSAQMQRQQLSALMDGELDLQQTQALLKSSQLDEDLLQAWSNYHAIGDALRAHASDSASRLTASPSPLPLPAAAQIASNDSVFRWKMVASLAAVAAVGSLMWSLVGLQSAATGVQIAQKAAPSAVSGQTNNSTTPANESMVMLRDPRLDELMAAHKQFGGASALQQPAGFLRNATFQASGR